MATNELTKYIALFHHRDNAQSAIQDLEKIGYKGNALTIIGGGNGSTYSDSKDTYGSEYGHGSESDLSSIGVPEKDRKHLQDGLQQGGTLLVLEGSGDEAEQIESIFHKHSTKKIDEVDQQLADPEPVVAAAAPIATVASDSTVIPVTQEDLVVGKREVDRGGVRVFRRIVETPVSESINLREEHVILDRKPVDRAVTEADYRKGDQVIELTETAEEAVVGKTARVVEEVHIGKEATSHIETIHDTLRHTEVDVEEVPATDTSATKSTKY